MTGRLWWRREGAWGLEIDGVLQPLVASVELVGATVRTRVNLTGGFTELPSGPAAIVEFEAQAITTTPHAAAANDNNRPSTAEEKT